MDIERSKAEQTERAASSLGTAALAGLAMHYGNKRDGGGEREKTAGIPKGLRQALTNLEAKVVRDSELPTTGLKTGSDFWPQYDLADRIESRAQGRAAGKLFAAGKANGNANGELEKALALAREGHDHFSTYRYQTPLLSPEKQKMIRFAKAENVKALNFAKFKRNEELLNENAPLARIQAKPPLFRRILGKLRGD